MSRAPAGSVAVLGSINLDSVVRVRRFPQPGETVMATGITRHLGGKGANQAIAAARAGAAVSLIGAVGSDAEGQILLAMLRQDEVNCDAVRIVDAPTGVAHILVDDRGENQIVVASGANALVTAPPTTAERVLLAQLESPIDAVLSFFAGRPTYSLTMLNAAPVHPDAGPCLAEADIVVVNETELAAFCGAPAPPRSPSEAAGLARALLARSGQRIIVTLGSAGSVTVDQAGVTISPGIPATVVDTTGAGDCFCGYLAAGLAMAQPLPRSLTVAHHAAALSVGRPGASASVPLMAELRSLVPDGVRPGRAR